MGLELICAAAQQGLAQAQYSYGAHLLRQGTATRAEAKMWLQLAADQGHRQANILLRSSGRLVQPAAALGPGEPPALLSCPAIGPFLPTGDGPETQEALRS